MSPVIATMLIAAVAVVCASVLYTMTSGLLVSGSVAGHSCLGPQVRVLDTDQGWFVELLTLSPGTQPAGLFLEVKAPDGSVSLQRTALSALTPDSGVEYRDANPHEGDIRPGDGVALDAWRFVEGSTLAISDASGMVTIRSLL